MTNYYFDIESEGFDYDKDQIITIQYQPLDKDGKPSGELIILKSWESSEEQIVKEFHKIFISDNPFSFTAIGFNLIFDLSFIYSKFKKYNLPLKSKDFMQFLFRDKPHIDIKYSCIIANNLDFKGSGLDKMTDKKVDGKVVIEWYNNKEYSKIEEYIKEEAESFLFALSIMKRDLNNSKSRWKKQK